MMSHKEIGKISQAWFGAGGYDDAMLGWSFIFSGDAWGCSDFWGHWRNEPSSTADWTNESRDITMGGYAMKVGKLMLAAKVTNFNQLVGRPVEVTFDRPGGRLQSWRILTEVL